MAFGQIFKKYGGNNDSTGDSIFDTEEEVKIPEIDGAINQIQRTLRETGEIEVRDPDPPVQRRGCGCWG